MSSWHPIPKEALLKRVSQGETRMTPAQRRHWNAIRVEPQKWKQDPYGRDGDGFWVVALIGQTVIWYNDLEEGFNRSRYSTHGIIDDYWCNQDELEVTIGFLMTALEKGPDLVLLRRPAEPVKP
jgi:hypothetical protein